MAYTYNEMTNEKWYVGYALYCNIQVKTAESHSVPH